MRRVFASWITVAEYLVFVGGCIAGVNHARWLWIPIGAMTLLLVNWSWWRTLFINADAVDALRRRLAACVHRRFHTILAMLTKTQLAIFVLVAKAVHDTTLLSIAYVVGFAASAVWGVGGYDPSIQK
jgi:hypothetical protein